MKLAHNKAQQLKERKKDKCASHQLSKSNGNEADGSLNSKCEIISQMFSVFTSPPFTCQSGMPVCHLLHLVQRGCSDNCKRFSDL